jgi:hypothetical protein
MSNANGGDGADVFQEAGEEDFKVNFGNVGDPEEFKPIPRGDYNVVFDQTDYGISKNSGKPMITARLEISDGEYEGRKLWTWLSFSEKAMPFTKMAFSQFAPHLLEAGDISPRAIAEDGELERFLREGDYRPPQPGEQQVEGVSLPPPPDPKSHLPKYLRKMVS